MSDNKYPWAFDKPLHEIQEERYNNASYEYPMDWKWANYLLDRLKIAEAERDEYRKRLEDAQWRLHD